MSLNLKFISWILGTRIPANKLTSIDEMDKILMVSTFFINLLSVSVRHIKIEDCSFNVMFSCCIIHSLEKC